MSPDGLNLRRAIVFGNAGSGKSWLATRLGSASGVEPVRLDALHWLPGGYGAARDKQEVARLVAEAAEGDGWIIEGVYGWLVEIAARRATALIWLDLPDADCLAALRARGLQGGGSAADFEALLKWASEYRLRSNANSFVAHERIYESFAGSRLRLTSREAVSALARTFGQA